MDNLRAALAWSLHAGEVELGLRIAAALRWVWEMRGYLEEGFAWFTRKSLESESLGGILLDGKNCICKISEYCVECVSSVDKPAGEFK
jgi:hypothetical protein